MKILERSSSSYLVGSREEERAVIDWSWAIATIEPSRFIVIDEICSEEHYCLEFILLGSTRAEREKVANTAKKQINSLLIETATAVAA